jgi:hypothetical protein
MDSFDYLQVEDIMAMMNIDEDLINEIFAEGD